MLLITSCGNLTSDATIASSNLSEEAEDFKVFRRLIFYNGITGEYMLEIKGYLSIETNGTADRLEVTCKTEGGYKKHFLGLSDNVTYFCEQIDPAVVGTDRYEVSFKPSVLKIGRAHV